LFSFQTSLYYIDLTLDYCSGNLFSNDFGLIFIYFQMISPSNDFDLMWWPFIFKRL